MSEPAERERRYLVVVRGDRPGDTLAAVKTTTERLEKMSVGKTQLAFSSADTSVCGIFAKIAKPAQAVRAALESAATFQDRGFVMVMELGSEFSSLGNGAGLRWLQK